MGKYKGPTCGGINGLSHYVEEPKTIIINYNGFRLKGTVISITEENGEIYLEMGK